MTSSAENKTCGICSGNMATGQGQAIFTAECSHSFHFSCIANTGNTGNHLCPVCNAKWNNLPLTRPRWPLTMPCRPLPSTNTNHNNTFNNPFFNNNPFQFCPFPTPQFPTIYAPPPQPQFPLHSRFDPDPLLFSDDEPLLANPMSSSSHVTLQKVAIKAVPERPALAASESVSQFTVLVGLKAPSLSDNARSVGRAPIDLVTVLDVSGSMCGSKLALLKQAVHFVIDNLSPSDRLSIVSFSDQAWRMLPLKRMTENGREDAKCAVGLLSANGGTNIVQGLKKGVCVLEERRHKNPVTSIIFLSDGNDTYNRSSHFQTNFSNASRDPGYLHLLPASIYPRRRGSEGGEGGPPTFPVHSFGFGSDHDPITMHAISDASGGTFSFIESYEMVQDAFAGCIGGLLSVVTQQLCLTLRSASHGVEIKSIYSGRYESKISDQESQGLISVGEMYADEEKEFLINLSVPILANAEGEENERKTSLLDIMCSYRDIVSKEMIQIEGDLVEIRRSDSLSPQDITVNVEVDRQRNRQLAAEGIAQAQQMAEAGNLTGAQTLLAKRRSDILASASAQAGDGLCTWLEVDMKETERRMGNLQMYQQSGRAFALSGMSSHAFQRATTKGNAVAGAAVVQQQQQQQQMAGRSARPSIPFGAYATPCMGNMVHKSQQLSKNGDTMPKTE